ncbi:MAG: hypothetical protein ACAI35_11195 [Candidatus Methylacidiphilales bacterium]|nr:hypothetical protein [Candidatus Methylacidiphilales bacterium]
MKLLAVYVAVLLSVATQFVNAEDFRVVFEKKTAVERANKEDSKMGNGLTRVERLNFDAEVTYSGVDSIHGVTVTFYVIGTNNFFDRKDQKLILAGKFVHAAQEFGNGTSKKYEMGPIGFEEFETRNGNTKWRGGVKWEGWVAEFAKDGKIIARIGKTPDQIKKVERGELIENVRGIEKPPGA